MEIVEHFHSKGRSATVSDVERPPGRYHYIAAGGKLFHYCYIHREAAVQTAAVLQSQWNALAVALKASHANLRELRTADTLKPKLIAQVEARIAALEEQSHLPSEKDRDLLVNFESNPHDCTISARLPRVVVE